MAESIRVPDMEAQRAAMRKLGFLIGQWAGEAWMLRPGRKIEMIQTEAAEYRLNGLVLVIEGVGRNKADNQPVLQALGIISYDDESETYTMRAFNDGRFLETEVKLLESGQGLTWGFVFGEYKTSSVLRMNGNGQWTEQAEISIGGQSPIRLMELTVSRQ